MKKIVLRIISLAVTVIMLLSTMMMTSADKLSVTQEEYNKYDVVKKAAYNYYKEDFTLTLGEGYVRATTLESRPAGGALCVKPEEVNDEQMVIIAREIVQKIEAELQYPGQIKVHMIRESRAIDYAK